MADTRRQDAAALLRAYRRRDYEGMRILIESYRPDLSPILAATILLCRGILLGMTEDAGEADEILSRWVSRDGPEEPRDRAIAAGLVSTSRPSAADKVPTAGIHFALLSLADWLNSELAQSRGEDPDEVLDEYLIHLAKAEDDA